MRGSSLIRPLKTCPRLQARRPASAYTHRGTAASMSASGIASVAGTAACVVAGAIAGQSVHRVPEGHHVVVRPHAELTGQPAWSKCPQLAVTQLSPYATSGQFGTPRKRPAHWSSRHHLGCSS
jgi:hypothetical protein